VELVVDGEPFLGNLLPAFADGKIHEVIATMLPQVESPMHIRLLDNFVIL
jgi:hypothetical protein